LGRAQRFERDDVLAVGQHHASDRNLVHLPDGLADDREGIVADLAVRTQVVGRMRYLGSISLRSTNSSILMVLVDSSATFSSSSLVTSTKVSVSTL
jgi:hypothetical protein